MVDRVMSKAEAARVLHRVGIPPDRIEALLAQLEDPIDLDRDAAVLDRHGVTRERLIDLMGGNP